MDNGDRKIDVLDGRADVHPQAGPGSIVERDRHIERKLDEIIDEYLEAIVTSQPIGDVIRCIAQDAFGLGVDRDTLIAKLSRRKIFSTEGKLGNVLGQCIGDVIVRVYDKAGAIKISKGPFDKKRRARAALLNFLTSEFTPDKLSVNFFRDLVEGRIDEVGSIIDTEHPGKSVKPEYVLDWAVSEPVIRLIVNRMEMFIEPLVRDEYRKYIHLNPGKYIANFLNDILRVNATGPEFKISQMDELFADICLSMEFSAFWKIVEGYMDATERDFRDRYPDRKFDSGWFEQWEPFFKQRWAVVQAQETVRTAQQAVYVEPLGNREISLEQAEAVRREVSRSVRFALLSPGTLMGGEGVGSGSYEKWRVIVQGLDGKPITDFFAQHELTGSSEPDVRRYVRKMLFGNSTVADVLRKKGLNLKSDGPEVEELTVQLVRARKGHSQEPAPGLRRNRRTGYKLRR